MLVTLKGSHMVKPTEPTSGNLSLSEWDQIGTINHASIIYFYQKPCQKWLTSSDSIVNSLKDSLSKILVTFYPLAGRLRRIGRGRLELDCNDAGVELIEAESNANLEDFGYFSLSSECECLVPEVDYNVSLEELPLLLIQLTKFQCGGISLCISISHVVADGLSMGHFISEWARTARGEQLQMAPVFDRQALRANWHSPALDGFELDHHPSLQIAQSSYVEQLEKTSDAMLRLTKAQVEKIRNRANDGKMGRPYSRYEALTAHIWRCVSKARGLKPDQRTAVGVCVDSRGRMQPQLPIGYFGNAIVDVAAVSRSGELVEESLGYACRIIREAIEKVNNRYLRSIVNYLEKQEDLTSFQDLYALGSNQGPLYGYPNIGVVSLLTLPVYGKDFGFGKEICVRPGSYDFDGDTVIIPSAEGDGSVIVALCLQSGHMDAFKMYFYQDMF
ncbi:putative Anthranilate N-benzoyltransferase protein [Tripterygium wilfordii]|uniref:Putative Anthranilate N-benzoyltransferase protein n=1 Tax=Tripterygium wilfordii TaxID=458696 RepID=A0A7J7DIE5_TRIWF|nr:spermidine hydroxycinnamoyl transferase-like [Tripterygium wilfordii]KAF5746004.1 putative Anthranilate N-benzoyltransferase protein [Tripterygium wilfordii]